MRDIRAIRRLPTGTEVPDIGPGDASVADPDIRVAQQLCHPPAFSDQVNLGDLEGDTEGTDSSASGSSNTCL